MTKVSLVNLHSGESYPTSLMTSHLSSVRYSDLEVNIVSVNGLVPDGTEPLPEAMVTKLNVIGHH